MFKKIKMRKTAQPKHIFQPKNKFHILLTIKSCFPKFLECNETQEMIKMGVENFKPFTRRSNMYILENNRKREKRFCYLV